VVDAWTGSSTAPHRLDVEREDDESTRRRTGRKRVARKERTLSPQLILINAKSLLLGAFVTAPLLLLLLLFRLATLLLTLLPSSS
jgi:hypothetical protein